MKKGCLILALMTYFMTDTFWLFQFHIIEQLLFLPPHPLHPFLLTHQATTEQVVIIITHGVRPSVTKIKTSYNANVKAHKAKYALLRTLCLEIMIIYWLWPVGSL